MSTRLCLLLFLWFTALAQPAELVTYPGPAGIVASDLYSVTVSQAGKTHPSFVYKIGAQWRTNVDKTSSFTTFSFSGTVLVEAMRLSGEFADCRILPSSYGVKVDVRGNRASFTLSNPREVTLDCEGTIADSLHIFANPIEKRIPREGSPHVLYFKPGVHDLGRELQLEAGQTVYLAGGAYVYGRFSAQDAPGIVIRGRGVLSGEKYSHGTGHMISLRGHSDKALVEGITIVQSPEYFLDALGTASTVRNVKMFGWYFNTDGVATGTNGVVEDCFFKVNDDAIKLYQSGMKVRRCVIWQMENGAPFQISWNIRSDNSGFRVKDCDVIRCEHIWPNDNNAIFNSVHGGSGHMSDYRFEKIRIENSHYRLLRLSIQPNEFAVGTTGLGQISGLFFRDITVSGPMKMPNVIKGGDAQHRIQNVRFENVSVDGKLLSNAGSFEIDPATTYNVTFAAPSKRR